jgi:hypothetical protein
VASGLAKGEDAAEAPPPAELAAKARARADEIIAAGRASPYVVNITDGAAPKVRHLASGMECLFGLEGEAAVTVGAGPTAAPDESVSCTLTSTLASGARVLLTLTATRPERIGPLEDLLDQAAASLKRPLSDATPASDPFTSINLAAGAGEAPVHRALRFQATLEGQPVFARAAVGVARGWVISEQTTAPAQAARAADMLSEVLLSVALTDVFYAGDQRKAP